MSSSEIVINSAVVLEVDALPRRRLPWRELGMLFMGNLSLYFFINYENKNKNAYWVSFLKICHNILPCEFLAVNFGF